MIPITIGVVTFEIADRSSRESGMHGESGEIRERVFSLISQISL